MSIGLEVWTIVEKGYDVPKVTPTGAKYKKKFWEHAKALNTLQSGLEKKVLAKVLTAQMQNNSGINWKLYMQEIPR